MDVEHWLKLHRNENEILTDLKRYVASLARNGNYTAKVCIERHKHRDFSDFGRIFKHGCADLNEMRVHRFRIKLLGWLEARRVYYRVTQ